MAEDLSNEDRLELERRRLTEEVTQSVERTLRKRYTWLALVISFLIGGGVATIIDNMTSTAQEQLVRAEVTLDEIDAILKEGRGALKELKALRDSLEIETRRVNAELEGLQQARFTSIETQKDFFEQAASLTARFDTLRAEVDYLKELSTKEHQASVSVQVPAYSEPKLAASLERTTLSRYTVSIQYTYEKDKATVQKLAEFLKKKGYIVPGIQLVKQKIRDIRYYHESDAAGCERLRENIYDFLDSQDTKRIPLDLKNLGEQYPNVRQGTVEVWLYF